MVKISEQTEQIEQIEQPRKRKRRDKQTFIQTIDTEIINELNYLVTTVFDLASLGLGEHWQLTDQESQQLTKALYKYLKTQKLHKKALEIAAPASLLMTVAVITIPRVILSYYSYKEATNLNNVVELKTNENQTKKQ